MFSAIIRNSGSARTRAAYAARRYSSTMHDNDPDVLEREKKRVLSRKDDGKNSHVDGAPGWNEHLASTSEASIKADRASHESAEDLQKRTVEYVKSRTSKEEAPTVADYPTDNISGPLGSAKAGDR